MVGRLLSRVGRQGLEDRDIEGHTVLFAACLYGHEEVARVLLRAGADPTVRNLEGWTVVQGAWVNGHLGCVALLQVSG
jgi:ankyrin repeat protein